MGTHSTAWMALARTLPRLAKRSSSLAEGVSLERRLFGLLFSTEDQKEGMAAFIEKRKAEWKGK